VPVAIRHIETLLATTSAPVNVTPCSISGSAPQGSTLTVAAGSWSGTPTPTLTYQWRRGGTNIAGATGTTYQTKNADVGLVVDVVETATNSAGTASHASSNSVTPTTAGFHTGNIVGNMPLVADIVVEWAGSTTTPGVGDDAAGALLLLLSD
jgi:hypothetical protein